LVDYLVYVEFFPKGLILSQKPIDKLVDVDRIIKIEILSKKNYCLFMSFSIILQYLLFFKEPSLQNRWIFSSRRNVRNSAFRLSLSRSVSSNLIYCIL